MIDLDGRFRRPLLTYFRRRANLGTEAEDYVQEVFVRMAGHPNINAIEHVEAYVFRVASNVLKDGMRLSRNRRMDQHVDIDRATGHEALIESIEPERIAIGRERVQRVVDVLAELPERTRDIFILNRMEKLRHREIAERIGISVSAVEKHLVKAIGHLDKRLGRKR